MHIDDTTTPNTPARHTPSVAVERRTIIQGAAWAVPVLAGVAAAPAQASSPGVPTIQDIKSNFGIGWYPFSQGSTSSGQLQFDSHCDKWFYVENTSAGQTLKNIRLQVLVQTSWGTPYPTFSPMAGSNPSWPALTWTGATETLGGITYRVYETSYSGTVAAVNGTTHIPIGFYYAFSSRFYSGVTVRTRRLVTVGRAGQPDVNLVLTGPLTPIINTNVPVGHSAHPRANNPC